MKYDTEIVYTKGTNMYIADMLSRAFLKGVKYLPIGEEYLKQIQLEIQRDGYLEALKQIITHGWPENTCDVPPTLVPYYGMRDELTTQNGLIFRGEEIVIPLGLRADM